MNQPGILVKATALTLAWLTLAGLWIAGHRPSPVTAAAAVREPGRPLMVGEYRRLQEEQRIKELDRWQEDQDFLRLVIKNGGFGYHPRD